MQFLEWTIQVIYRIKKPNKTVIPLSHTHLYSVLLSFFWGGMCSHLLVLNQNHKHISECVQQLKRRKLNGHLSSSTLAGFRFQAAMNRFHLEYINGCKMNEWLAMSSTFRNRRRV